jgi:hypothetical protein
MANHLVRRHLSPPRTLSAQDAEQSPSQRVNARGWRGTPPAAAAAEQALSAGATASAHRPVVTDIGDAGAVYLCHPFLAHAAQPHHGRRPRFLAQPPLQPVDPDNRPREDLNPVEQATARALDRRL